MRGPRSRSMLAVLVIAALSLVGCVTDSPHELARAKAERAQLEIINSGKDDGVVMARKVGRWGEVMEASGDARDPDGATVVLRVTATGQNSFSFTSQQTTVTECYRLHFERSAGPWVNDLDRVDCPDSEPLELPTTTMPPSLPDHAEQTLRDALAADAAEGEPDALRDSLEAAIPGALVDVQRTTSDDVGVAISIGDSCLFGRRTAAGVETWRPYNVKPGELTCTSDTASAGAGMSPPH